MIGSVTSNTVQSMQSLRALSTQGNSELFGFPLFFGRLFFRRRQYLCSSLLVRDLNTRGTVRLAFTDDA